MLGAHLLLLSMGTHVTNDNSCGAMMGALTSNALQVTGWKQMTTQMLSMC